MRTSSFSGCVYNYIDVFLDNTGDPDTAAAVNQMETREKHQKASQAAHPLPWGCISTAHVTADSLPARSQGTASTAWAGRAQPHFSAPTLVTAALLRGIPTLLYASEGNNVMQNMKSG